MYFKGYKPTRENIKIWELCKRLLPDLTPTTIEKLKMALPSFMSRYWRQRIEATRALRVPLQQKMILGTDEYRRQALENVRGEMLSHLMAYLLARPEERNRLELLESESRAESAGNVLVPVE